MLLFQFHWNYFEFSYFGTQVLLRMHIYDPVCAVLLLIICAYSYKCFNPFSSQSNIFNHIGLSYELNQYQSEEINKAHNTVGLSLVMLEPPTQ